MEDDRNSPKKILVCGAVKGNYDEVFKKCEEICKKNDFKFMICVGNFWSTLSNDLATTEELKDYISGKKHSKKKTKKKS